MPRKPRHHGLKIDHSAYVATAVSTLIADVNLLTVDAPVVVSFLQELVTAKVIGINPTFQFYVPNR